MPPEAPDRANVNGIVRCDPVEVVPRREAPLPSGGASGFRGLLDSPQMPKSQVVSIMAAQKSRLNSRDLLHRAYAKAGLDPAKMPIASLTTCEAEVRQMILNQTSGVPLPDDVETIAHVLGSFAVG